MPAHRMALVVCFFLFLPGIAHAESPFSGTWSVVGRDGTGGVYTGTAQIQEKTDGLAITADLTYANGKKAGWSARASATDKEATGSYRIGGRGLTGALEGKPATSQKIVCRLRCAEDLIVATRRGAGGFRAFGVWSPERSAFKPFRAPHAPPSSKEKAADYFDSVLAGIEDRFRLEPGEIVVVASDQDPPTSTGRAHRWTNRRDYLHSYTGHFTVLKRQPSGELEVLWQGRGATHPAGFGGGRMPPPSRNRAGYHDVNGDNRKDYAWTRPGVYEYRSRPLRRNGRFHPTTDFPAVRDTNYDGTISAEESAASKARGDLATAIQIHPGRTNRPSSVGCLTMPPKDYAAFKKLIRKEVEDATFPLILIRHPHETDGENPTIEP